MMRPETALDSILLNQFASADESACEAAAIKLGRQGVTGLAALAELLPMSQPDLRFWAVRGLWANGSTEAVALLLKTLADPAAMVRSGAAYALGELKAEMAVEALARLVTSDTSEAGQHAADALAKIGINAAPILIKILPDKRAWVRVRAAKALAAVECTEAIPALFEALDDESYLVRHHAEEALARLGVGQMVYFQVSG